MDSDPRRRLAEAIRKRRLRLGLSVREAAKRAGVAQNTWAGAEKGTQRTAEYNYAGLERTLMWAQGSVDELLAGGEPTELDELPADSPAGDRAVVLQIIEIMATDYRPETKLTMIEDVISRDFVPDEAAAADQRMSA